MKLKNHISVISSLSLAKRIGRAGVGLCFGISFLLFSCSKSEEVKPEDVALQTAKVYYDQLLNGDYDSFVAGSLQGDSVPEAYRKQLVLNSQMFVERLRKEHQGIDSIIPLRANGDSASHTASAFMAFCFADSTREEVVVPMIEKNGVWYLR